MTQREYKWKYDSAPRLVHCHLCGEQTGESKQLVWAFPRGCSGKQTNIQCDHLIEAGRLNEIVVNKNEREWIIGIAVPGDTKESDKKKENVEKYQDSKREIKKIWNKGSEIFLPVIVGALGTISKNLDEWLEKLELGTTKTLKKAHEY